MSEQDWDYIPQEAFLYFPTGEEVRTGKEEKQWRKIFEGGMEYEPFEESALEKLEAKLQEKNTRIDEWFDRPNRLRFLQANKFKTSNTIDSMLETTKWRSTDFPIKMDPAVTKMLVPHPSYRTQERFISVEGMISTDPSWWQISANSMRMMWIRFPRC